MITTCEDVTVLQNSDAGDSSEETEGSSSYQVNHTSPVSKNEPLTTLVTKNIDTSLENIAISSSEPTGSDSTDVETDIVKPISSLPLMSECPVDINVYSCDDESSDLPASTTTETTTTTTTNDSDTLDSAKSEDSTKTKDTSSIDSERIPSVFRKSHSCRAKHSSTSSAKESILKAQSLTDIHRVRHTSKLHPDQGVMKPARSLHDIILQGMEGDLETDIDEVDDQDLEVVLSSPVMKDIAPVVMVTNLDIIFKQTQERFHYTFNEQGPSEINTQSARHLEKHNARLDENLAGESEEGSCAA